MTQISIAKARDNLTRLIRRVEAAGAVELTRRGKPVAVLVSADAFRRLERGVVRFSDAYDRFRSACDDDLDLDPDAVFGGVRDRSTGRDVAW